MKDLHANRVAPNPSGGLERIERIGRLLDAAVTIPGTSIQVGLDGLVGFFPGIGDALTTGMSAFLLYEGARLGVSKRTLLRMLGNIAIDALVGAVPVLGDLFDIAFKANLRNVALLKEDLLRAERPARSARGVSALALLLLFGSVLVVIIVCSAVFLALLLLLL